MYEYRKILYSKTTKRITIYQFNYKYKQYAVKRKTINDFY
jgi:hypothetical protein